MGEIMSEYNINFDAWLADQDPWVQGVAQSNAINEAMRRAYYAGKARYDALEAAIWDDDMPYDIAYGGRQATSHLDDRFFGISDYRARLLAKIEDKETT